MNLPSNSKIISFVASGEGKWNVISVKSISGASLEKSETIDVIEGYSHPEDVNKPTWVLNAFKSNLRYTTRNEKTTLDRDSMSLGRPEFNHAALIPIKKSDAWWLLSQDERRKIFEEDSRHIQISSKYLSAISRQLHHSRDLGEAFDFLTWFEFASDHDGVFDELCSSLRKTEEWKYVVREVDIRLELNPNYTKPVTNLL